ncbi:Translation initiation factor eIF-2B subunit beta [Intoshia linei]|uniref:Translation initiation factor eIF2B subunit beta n=1 Tax=Intoshia linei TaxID=1819745 RepID=A0A177B4M7_9BILA|nr:Translation initiation factor eIF-2B subunit beta [Intoshia linei]
MTKSDESLIFNKIVEVGCSKTLTDKIILSKSVLYCLEYITVLSINHRILKVDDNVLVLDICYMMNQFQSLLKLIHENATSSGAVYIVLRVLKTIRDEYILSITNTSKSNCQINKERKILLTDSYDVDYKNVDVGLERTIRESLQELCEELGQLHTHLLCLSSSILSYESNNVMIMDCDPILDQFFKKAVKKTKLTVNFVATAISHQNLNVVQKKYTNLHDIHFTVVPYNDIYSSVPNMSSILLVCRTLFMDGSVLVTCGAKQLALVCKKFNVPVYILAHIHNLDPGIVDENKINFLQNPSQINQFKDDDTQDFNGFIKKPSNYFSSAPKFEILHKDYVTYIVTNRKIYYPENIYQLIQEIYHAEDINFLSLL